MVSGLKKKAILIGVAAMLILLIVPRQPWAATSTIDTKVAGSNSDASEDSGGWVNYNGDILLLDSSHIVGLRFAGLPIPQEATITRAYIDVEAANNYTGALSVTIKGHDSGDSSSFYSFKNNISSRGRTAEQATWNLTDWVVGDVYQSPDLTAIVQEIVDRADWSFGNPLSLIIEASGVGQRGIKSYDNNFGKNPALLHVEYTANAISVPISAGNDDAGEKNGYMYLNSSTLDIGDRNYLIGLRFDNVMVPQYTPIDYAYIEFASRIDKDQSCNMTIAGQAHDDPPSFTSFNNDITNRTRTSQQIRWHDVPPWARFSNYYTPDLKDIVQEIIGRDGWRQGQAMAFIISGLNSDREAYSYDGDMVRAPILHIGFSETIDTARLQVSTNILGATCNEGESASDVNFTVTNTGALTLNYTVSTTYNIGSNWLSLTPSDQTDSLGAGASREYSIGFSSAGLAAGNYEAVIQLEDPAAAGSPQEIFISLLVFEVPELATCGHVPIYAENLVSPAILILLDISSSMHEKMEVATMDPLPRTPDLKTILQEIVDRDSWQSGSAMVFMLTGSGERIANSWDNSSGSSPKLHIEYSHLGMSDEVDVRIKQGSDDAYEKAGQRTRLWDNQLDLVKDDDGFIGLRFQEVSIPQGATVTRAYIEFFPLLSDAISTNVAIYGQYHDNPATFAYQYGNISDRFNDQKTTAFVNWDIPRWYGTTMKTRWEIGKDVISDLVKDRSISWGYGTWCSNAPWNQVADGSYTIIHVGTKPNTDEHQEALQDAVSATKYTGGTPFSPSIMGARLYFEGSKADENGETYRDIDCQPKILIDVTDGMGNVDSTVENVRQRTQDLADAGVSSVGVGFGLDYIEAGLLYEMADVSNIEGNEDEDDYVYALHPENDLGVAEPYFAFNESELMNAFRDITETVKGAIFYGSAPAPTTSADLGDTVIVAKFDPSFWTGDVEAISKSANGQWDEVKWSAMGMLPSIRKVFTIDPASGQVVQYSDGIPELDTDDYNCVYSDRPIGDIINSTPIVVGAPPFYYPFDDYHQFAQDMIFTTKRDAMIYIGSNDGSLHALDLKSGEEKWAFIPEMMHDKLNLAGVEEKFNPCGDGYCHQYLLDGSPQAGDVYADFYGTGKQWRTILVTGAREGAEAYFALDVTTGKAFDDINPSKFLWEFSEAELGQTWSDPIIERVAIKDVDPDTATAWAVFFGSGYASDPIVQSNKEAYLFGILAHDASMLWKDKDGLPVNRIKLSSGSGTIAYDNWESSFKFPDQTGEILTGATSGATGTIVDVHIEKRYSHGTIELENVSGTFMDNEVLMSSGGGEAEANGTLSGIFNDALSTPLLVDMQADYVADRIYAGNLYGDMFRVTNIGKHEVPEVSKLFSFNHSNPSPDLHPIRAKAEFGYDEDDNEIWVYFGTGRYEEQLDKRNNEKQYFFGLPDNAAGDAYYEGLGPPLVTLQAKFKTVSIDGQDMLVRYLEGDNSSHDPWAIELNTVGNGWGGPSSVGSERVMVKPLVVGGIVFFVSFIPDSDVCSGNGETFVFAVDYDTGMAPIDPVFDLNGDGEFDDNDKIEVDGEWKAPVGLRAGRGQGSHPTLQKSTLFITTTGDGDKGGGNGGLKNWNVNIEDRKIKVEAWREN